MNGRWLTDDELVEWLDAYADRAREHEQEGDQETIHDAHDDPATDPDRSAEL